MKSGVVVSERWEQGSEYHWVQPPCTQNFSDRFPGHGVYTGSGRDALCLLLQYGMETKGWERIWVPTYFCQDVIYSIVSTGIRVKLYYDSPVDRFEPVGGCELCKGDTLLVVNYFGLRVKPNYNNIDRAVITIIEDHTHDPWSNWAVNSEADWCITSLRKTLPIPDGGILWSPQGLSLPPPVLVSGDLRLASLEKYAAMVLKSLYLRGYSIDKDIFRSLAISGEDKIGSGQISGMTDWAKALLSTFPVTEWRQRRKHNFQVFAGEVAGIVGLKLLKPEDKSASCPFSCFVVFDSSEHCSYVWHELIQSSVYPAILWPLSNFVIPGIPSEHLTLSQRVLSIHCDMRYDDDDMRRVAVLIKRLGEEFSNQT